jgi:hypothetical protein
MRKTIFKLLALFNRLFVPRMSRKDLTRLTKWQKAIVAWRYWVTTNVLD